MATLTFVDPQFTALPQIRSLIGDDVVRFRREHPLYSGLDAMRRSETGLSVEDLQELWQTELDARPIVDLLLGRGNDERVRHDLSTESECRGLLFESRVAGLFLRPFTESVDWRRYDQGPDFLTKGPTIQVECTQAGKHDLEAMLHKAKRKRHQRQANAGPFIVIVGTRTGSDVHIFTEITPRIASDLDGWHPRHPEVSAVHFCAPQAIAASDSASCDRDGNIVVNVAKYTGFTVRNLRAEEPLPAGFEDNWRADGDPQTRR